MVSDLRPRYSVYLSTLSILFHSPLERKETTSVDELEQMFDTITPPDMFSRSHLPPRNAGHRSTPNPSGKHAPLLPLLSILLSGIIINPYSDPVKKVHRSPPRYIQGYIQTITPTYGKEDVECKASESFAPFTTHMTGVCGESFEEAATPSQNPLTHFHLIVSPVKSK